MNETKSRPESLNVCACGAPLIFTFIVPRREWYCLECGRVFEMFGARSRKTTDELYARYLALDAEFKEHMAPYIPPRSYRKDCEKCYGVERASGARRYHRDHATPEQLAASGEAWAWLQRRTSGQPA